MNKNKNRKVFIIISCLLLTVILCFIAISYKFNRKGDIRVASCENDVGDKIIIYHPFLWEIIPEYYFEVYKNGNNIARYPLDLLLMDFEFIACKDSRIIGGVDRNHSEIILFFYDFMTDEAWLGGNITNKGLGFIKILNSQYPERDYQLGSTEPYTIPENQIQQALNKLKDRYLLSFPENIFDVNIGFLGSQRVHIVKYSLFQDDYIAFINSFDEIRCKKEYSNEYDNRLRKFYPSWFKYPIDKGEIILVAHRKIYDSRYSFNLLADTSKNDTVVVYMIF